MVNTLVLFCLCLSRLLDVTESVKSVSVMEGDSVTLNSDVTEVQKYLMIQWAFGSTRIAEVNWLTQSSSMYDGPDGRFKNRLKLDHQTGSLTITNTRTTDSGLYKRTILADETKYESFYVTVYESPRSTSSPSTSNLVTSSFVVNNSTVNSTVNQTENNNNTDLHQPSSDVTESVKSVSVMEGESVTLNTDVTEVQKYLMIQWAFGSTRIAEVNRLTQTSSTYDGPDGRFKNRLKLDHQTGSLTITNTRTTDSGLYQRTILADETKYESFYVTVYESPRSTSSPSTSNLVTSSFVVNNSTVNSTVHSTVNQTENNNNTDLHQPSSDHIHCCSFTEAVIRLALSAVVGVATVAVLVYDIRSRRRELIRTEESKYCHQSYSVKSDHEYELCREMSVR